MATTNRRMMVTVPDDLEVEIEKLKQSRFYNKSYSNMLVALLRAGLQVLTQEAEHEEQ